MSKTTPWIEHIPMGQTSAPLNSSVFNKASTKVITTGAAQTITTSDWCKSIEFIPSVIPTAPIFIKYQTSAGQGNATATDFDEVLTEAKPSCQVWYDIFGYQNSFSIFSTSTQTVYYIER